MYVINRKRISIVLCCLLLGIFAYSYQLSKINMIKENEITRETTAIPSSGKVIVIDARAPESLTKVQNLALEQLKQKLI